MRRIRRRWLPADVRQYLQRRTKALVGVGGTARAAAHVAWKSARRTKKVGRAITVLRNMNGGSARCMYCETDRGSQIDHFRPKALNPYFTFAWRNWVLACAVCNLNKLEAFSNNLINPTSPTYWFEHHFEFVSTTGEFSLKTPQATASEPVFGLNLSDLQGSRLEAFTSYESRIITYAVKMDAGDVVRARRYMAAAQWGPHPSVLATILRWYSGPGRALLDPACVDAIARYPSILKWR